MTTFMNSDFMLHNETAKHLFHDYAESMQLIDYHCHFGDYYKWRVMRSNGVPENIVTGNADPYEKFERFAEALEMAIGNPMYHWCNLELKKYFGINEPLTVENAREIWDKTSEMLQTAPSLTVRGIIEKSNSSIIF